MYFAQVSTDTYLLRFEKEEEIHTVLTFFLKKQKIVNAFLDGLGSIEDPLLAHYSVTTKKYSEKNLSGIYELTNLTGNVALFDNAPLIHIHVTLSDEAMRAYGGHLVAAKVSATLEMRVQTVDSAHTKSLSTEIGLKLWNLPEKI